MRHFLFSILTLFLFVFQQGNVAAQTKKQYMQFADENYEEGDYYGASIYYAKAMEIDSIDIHLIFKYAEALRKYNNYEKAEYYYQKVYDKGNGQIYPESVFWLATMQKFNGNYKEASKTWRRVKTLTRDRKSFEYAKAIQEKKSCTYARRISKYTTDNEVANIGEGVNTFDSEFSPFVLNGKLYYSSLRADNMGGDQQVKDELYKVKVYDADLKDSVWQTNEMLERSINNLVDHNANSCFSSDGSEFYFTRCSDFSSCKIMVAKYVNGKWSSPEAININNASGTTTQPMMTTIDGKEYLFFASDRKGGEGKMDIWYAEKKGFAKFEKPINAGKEVNSIDNEITPFYEPKEKVLYFSSEWHYGLGGFDIFSSKGLPGEFAKPENLMPPINTQWNDFYYMHDTANYKGYLASNRVGSMYYKSPTCCNDIYEVEYPKPVKADEIEIITLEDLNKYLPVTLYFHNDCPNPRTRDTTTNLNYLTTYNDYIKLIPTYEEEYSKGLEEDKAVEAVVDIQDFFTNRVKKGVKDLDLFTRLLLLELEKGTDIVMTVRGFASPLAKTDYNVKLTGRRISSLMNYLDEFEGGKFQYYIEKGQLSFIRIPFGEYTADKFTSDNVNDQKNSVYSRAAARERKIEIVSVNLANKSEDYAEIKVEKEIRDFGKVMPNDTLVHTFEMTNVGNIDLVIDSVANSYDGIEVIFSSETIKPNEKHQVEVKMIMKDLHGLQHQSITLFTNGIPEKKELSFTFEVQ